MSVAAVGVAGAVAAATSTSPAAAASHLRPCCTFQIHCLLNISSAIMQLRSIKNQIQH